MRLPLSFSLQGGLRGELDEVLAFGLSARRRRSKHRTGRRVALSSAESSRREFACQDVKREKPKKFALRSLQLVENPPESPDDLMLFHSRPAEG